MREIKFRAWCGNYFEHSEFNHKTGCLGCNFSVNTDDGKPIQQYIGRKDKNGIEIYERDILKDGNCIFVVPSIDELISMAFEENSFASFDDCEIIGNELENPELLKD